ncbi:hypothetical protein [Stigmatella aurantiaca]|uniref:Conserved uncharacterized protein n=1 Tax=Stigmatella aurantiaca (strain DW4/3-1) TaxID=378806 RepID=Q09BS6_STIAD|nr:hypothetical protein [Stigmatella aurantiaca]ADO73966.1 conserved uncharacterized protein [Stigmatella aurantiaca DW4/3-1]EAU69218.1 hypothetical protein STIAU_6164 [Stigmatella aurantiaca DW4/3-1]
MRGKQRAKTVVKLEEPRKPASSQKAPPQPPGEVDPLYGVVLLKVALELKRNKEGRVEDILRGVLARMRIPEHEFQAFLKQQGGRLKDLGLHER